MVLSSILRPKFGKIIMYRHLHCVTIIVKPLSLHCMYVYVCNSCSFYFICAGNLNFSEMP